MSITDLPVLVVYEKISQSNGQPRLTYHLARFTPEIYAQVQFADNETFLNLAEPVGHANSIEELAESFERGNFGADKSQMGILTTLMTSSNETYAPVELAQLKVFKEQYLLGNLC